jgi:hypothetical protein
MEISYVFCERTWNPQRFFTVTPPLSFIDPVFSHRTLCTPLLFFSLYALPHSLQIMSRARSNGRRLSALFDTPSSPLGPPTDGNSGISPTGSPSSGRPASDPVTPSNRRGSSSPYASPAALLQVLLSLYSTLGGWLAAQIQGHWVVDHARHGVWVLSR